MASISKIVALMGELEDQLVVCMRCGLCQAVCPLYGQTGREADVARGKLALLSALAEEMVKDAAGVKERLERCLLCGSCAANCPSGVRVLDVFLKARAILSSYFGLPPSKRLLLRGLLANPRLFDRLTGLAPKFQKLFISPADAALDTSCSRIGWFLGGRHFKPLAPIPFSRLAPARRPGPARGPKTAFFVGCLIDKIYPPVGTAALKVLKHFHVDMAVPPGQACCGIPALSAGDSGVFQRLLEHNLKVFGSESFDFLLTACATCAATINHTWPVLAADMAPHLLSQATAIAAKAKDVGQFLGEAGFLPPPSSPPHEGGTLVTYHDPCHLKKTMGVSDEPRRLIQQSPGHKLVEMDQPGWCCGMGGSFNLEHYELSRAIGGRKLESIIRTGAQVAATSCPACMLQITDGLSRAGAGVQVRHVLEIFAEAIDGEAHLSKLSGQSKSRNESMNKQEAPSTVGGLSRGTDSCPSGIRSRP